MSLSRVGHIGAASETAASPAREARLLRQERGCVGAVRTSEPVRPME